jgi:hypothetical protein
VTRLKQAIEAMRVVAGHKPEPAMKVVADPKAISRDKRSRFVKVVCGALVLAGQRERDPAAVAAVLAKPPL